MLSCWAAMGVNRVSIKKRDNARAVLRESLFILPDDPYKTGLNSDLTSNVRVCYVVTHVEIFVGISVEGVVCVQQL